MPTFTPKSDSELNAERLIPEGEYDFEIYKAANRTFKSGSAGIALTLSIYLPDGNMRLVDDYLVFVTGGIPKLSKFSKATGLYEKYKAGRIDDTDCENRSGRCKVGIEPEGNYPAKNKITSYVVPSGFAKPVQAQSAKVKPATSEPLPAPDDGEEVPF